MRTRHRIPAIFSLSMLDVFCCALGCVILLWLWNDRMAKQRAEAAGETLTLLTQSRADLADARQQLDALKGDLSAARSEAASLAADRDRVSGELAGARRMVDQKNLDLKNLQARADATAAQLASKSREAADAEELLAKKQKEQEALSASAAAVRKRVLELETLVREKEDRLALAMRRAADLDDKLHDAEGRMRQLKTTADTAANMRSDLDARDKQLAAADMRVRELERDLISRKTAMLDVQGKVEELQTEKRNLSDQITKIKLAADNRFAGIQLTGRRVVLLVDTSGSMKAVDENTPAPDKWNAVAETAVKILKSLPDLEKFQIITFAEETAYPVGAAGDWLDYDPNISPVRVRERLVALTPKGNTNMYVAFDAAFLYRPRGMDTIYLLSDGLPNVGPGLSVADQTRNLKESERETILGRHVRDMVRQKWNRQEIGQPKVRINSVGFFYESPDVGAFLWALSRENDGSFVGMSKP